MSAPILFFDIAGPDDDALRAFYDQVFGWNFSEQSQVSVDIYSPLGVAIRKDPAEKRIYIGVEDINACLDAVLKHGGTVDAPRFEVPGVVILGLFRDTAGNEMGLVEIEAGEIKVPRPIKETQ